MRRRGVTVSKCEDRTIYSGIIIIGKGLATTTINYISNIFITSHLI